MLREKKWTWWRSWREYEDENIIAEDDRDDKEQREFKSGVSDEYEGDRAENEKFWSFCKWT